MAELVVRIKAGGTRDEVSAMIAERHVYEWFAREQERDELPQKLLDVEAALSETRQAVAGKKGSALRASSAVVPPLKGTDQLGPDMAHQAQPPRGGEPH